MHKKYEMTRYVKLNFRMRFSVLPTAAMARIPVTSLQLLEIMTNWKTTELNR